MGAHAFIAPSSMGITVNCSYYPHVIAMFPQDDTTDTREGDAAHWVSEQCELLYRDTGQVLPAKSFLGQKSPRGVIIDEEICDSAQVMIDETISLSEKLGVRQMLCIEQRLHMPQIHPDACWGTVDLGFFHVESLTIYLRDFKHGWKIVDVYECWQMLCYLVGMIVHYPQAQYADIGIVQPRPYHKDGPVRTWRFPLSELPAYIEKMRLAVEQVFTNPVASTGDHCKYCEAQLHCQAFLKSAYNAIDLTEQPQLHDLSNEQLGKLYDTVCRAHNTVKNMKESLETVIEAKINAGEQGTGYVLDHNIGRSFWTEKPNKIIDICSMLGIENVGKVEAKTPIQVIDSLPKDDPRIKALTPYVRRGKGNTKLVPDDGRVAKRVFGNEQVALPQGASATPIEGK